MYYVWLFAEDGDRNRRVAWVARRRSKSEAIAVADELPLSATVQRDHAGIVTDIHDNGRPKRVADLREFDRVAQRFARAI